MAHGQGPAQWGLGPVPEETELRVGEERTGRSVVVGVDGSEVSKEALQWALTHFCRPGDTVALVHAREHIAGAGDTDGYLLYVEQMLGKMSMEAIEQYMVKCEQVVKSGEATDILLREVVSRDAVALIVGSHNKGAIKRAFIGSVSDFCSRHAECPVIIVRKKG